MPLNSILGGPVSAELVRKGANSCAVEGFFELDDQDQIARLADLGVLLEDGQLILRREIRGQGRSRAFVNGQGQPIKQLKQIGAILVDLHGQHEHQSLLDPKLHARFLDAFAGLDDQRRLVGQHWRAYRDSVARPRPAARRARRARSRRRTAHFPVRRDPPPHTATG